MRTPTRILRNTVTRIDRDADRLSEREQEQRTRILDLGQALMAAHGRHTLTMAAFALAIGRSTGSIRRHFPDLDSLLAHILHRHLQHIANALGDAARTHPNNQPALRSAYAAATRTALGALTEPHLLLTRDRHLLPEDERELLEQTRTTIGETIAGELGRQAMLLLDEPSFPPTTIEHMLAKIQDTVGWVTNPSLPSTPSLTSPPPRTSNPPPPPDPDWSSPAVQACLPQGWRPDPPRIHQPRAGPLLPTPAASRRGRPGCGCAG